MKNTIVKLIAIALFLAVVMLTTFYWSADEARYENSFSRILPPHAANIQETFEVDRQYSIAGITDQSIYLRSGGELLSMSIDLQDTCRVDVKDLSGYDIAVDGDFFYLHSGSSAEIKRGGIHTWRVDTTYHDLPAFITARPISPNSFILQLIDFKERKSLFTRSGSTEHPHDLLTGQTDGIFSTDGFLRYSKKATMLVYTYRYRNQFVCADTSLNVIRTGHTIDTTSVARVAITEVDNQIIMSKPPFVVNKYASVDGPNLFVASNLIAKNEVVEEINDRSVIDVYNIIDASYRYSFYVQDQANEKMQSFHVIDTVLIAIFPHAIARYNLTAEHLRN